jgi:hypothetical protein
MSRAARPFDQSSRNTIFLLFVLCVLVHFNLPSSSAQYAAIYTPLPNQVFSQTRVVMVSFEVFEHDAAGRF